LIHGCGHEGYNPTTFGNRAQSHRDEPLGHICRRELSGDCLAILAGAVLSPWAVHNHNVGFDAIYLEAKCIALPGIKPKFAEHRQPSVITLIGNDLLSLASNTDDEIAGPGVGF